MKRNERKLPMRRCIGCMGSKPKKDMIRITWYEDRLAIDEDGKAKGRGVYLCRDGACHQVARKKNAICRSLKAGIPKEQLDRIYEALEEYED